MLFVLVLVQSFGIAVGANDTARYLTFAEATETLHLFSGSGLPGTALADSDAWDSWIRRQDQGVRSRIDRGVEDSISNLILYGTSYTSLPRLENAESAVSVEGTVSAIAHERVAALVEAMAAGRLNERVQFAVNFLRRKRIARNRWEKFLTNNLQRFAQEQNTYQQKLMRAEESGDVNEKLSTRGTLYENRGLSVDTSLLVNYALEDTLQSLCDKGELRQASIRRIAVVGPGLDFTNKHRGYDFYPVQTIQPFAIYDSIIRLKLAGPGGIDIVAMDLNPAVNAHITKLVQEARAGHSYTVQVPRDKAEDWTDGAAAYWTHFGNFIGVPAKPLLIPEDLEGPAGVMLRAVAVAPRYAARVTPLDLNVVTQRAEFSKDRMFDLVIATNILVYYNRFQQALAMANIAAMMRPGGLFLTNDALSAHHTTALKFLDLHHADFAKDSPSGDMVLVYRRQ